MNTETETMEEARADALRWKKRDRRLDSLRGQFLMASVGISHVTLDNWQDFAVRAQLHQAIHGVPPSEWLTGKRARAMVGTVNRWAHDLDDLAFSARILRSGVRAARLRVQADSPSKEDHCRA